MLGDVNATVIDGNLGRSQAVGGVGTHFKIGVSDVSPEEPIFISGNTSYAAIKEKLGATPLYDSVLDSVENGASSIYAIPVSASVKGIILNDKSTKASTGTGDISLEGNPNNAYQIIVQVVESGGLNEATVKYSIDNGVSYSEEITVNPSGKMEMEKTGLQLLFTEAATEPEKSFCIGDTYLFETEKPTMTIDDVLQAVDKLKTIAIDFEFVHIVGESTKGLWAALCSKAEEFFSAYKKPVIFVVEARGQQEGETVEKYINGLLSERKGITSKYLQVVSAWVDYTKADGRRQITNFASIASGMYGRAAIQQSIGEVESFGISELKINGLLPAGIEGYLEQLDKARYLTVRQYYGLDSYFVSNAWVMSQENSDFLYIEDIRVLNKIIKSVRQKLLQQMHKSINVDELEISLNALSEYLSEPLENMADAGEISTGRVVVDTETNKDILTTEELIVEIYFMPIVHIRNIRVSYSMENPYKG